MSGFKWLLLGQAWLFIAPALKAQHHHNAWLRTTLSYQPGEKIRIDGEFQHRRQSGFGSRGCLDEKLMYTLRGWVHYKYKESVRFSVSPFAYFSHHRIIQERTDASADPTREIRFSASADLQHRLSGKFFITGRSALEYRIFDNEAPDVVRVRNRLGMRYDFTPKLKAGIYGELFLNVSGTTAYYFFDHKRRAFNLEYMLTPSVKVEAGYIHIVRLPPRNLERLKENNIFLNLVFQLRRTRD